jgi:hypothetical protein
MAIRGVSLYPKLFMKVWLEGVEAVPDFEPFVFRNFPGGSLTETLEVPWLGSVKDSMAWYNNKLTEIQPKFSRVNSIQWKEHMPQKSVFERSAETMADEQRFAESIGARPIPEQLLDGKPFAYSAVLKDVQGVRSRTMCVTAPGYGEPIKDGPGWLEFDGKLKIV